MSSEKILSELKSYVLHSISVLSVILYMSSSYTDLLIKVWQDVTENKGSGLIIFSYYK